MRTAPLLFGLFVVCSIAVLMFDGVTVATFFWKSGRTAVPFAPGKKTGMSVAICERIFHWFSSPPPACPCGSRTIDVRVSISSLKRGGMAFFGCPPLTSNRKGTAFAQSYSVSECYASPRTGNRRIICIAASSSTFLTCASTLVADWMAVVHCVCRRAYPYFFINSLWS